MNYFIGKIKVCLLGVALLLSFSGLAQAYTYATDVVWYSGSNSSYQEGAQRYDEDNALGEADNLFLSLGLGGIAIFDFGTAFDSSALILETTWGDRTKYLETAEVYVVDSSFDFASLVSASIASLSSDFLASLLDAFSYVGAIDNQNSDGVTIDLGGLSGPFQYLLIFRYYQWNV